MNDSSKRNWEFKRKFRAGSYRWNRSAEAGKNLRAAVSEIRKAFKKHPIAAIDAAIDLLDRIGPAFENIDSSSGAIGNAVDGTVEKITPLIVDAPLDATQRRERMERIHQVVQAERLGYLRRLPDLWGVLCATNEERDHWIQRFRPEVENSFRTDGYGCDVVSSCLSCLLESARYDELRELLDLRVRTFWPYESYWAEALLRQELVDEAVAHARSFTSDEDEKNAPPGTYCPHRVAIFQFCERALYDNNRHAEAYDGYALESMPGWTYLAHLKSLARRYPEYEPEQILIDLIERSGEPKRAWFSAARQCKQYDIALDCVRSGPVSSKTIARAARDLMETHPEFVWETSLWAIKYLLVDYPRADEEDVRTSVRNLVAGARNADQLYEAIASLRRVLAMRKKAIKVPNLVKDELQRQGAKLHMKRPR